MSDYRFCLFAGIVWIALSALPLLAEEPAVRAWSETDSVALNGELVFRVDMTWQGSMSRFQVVRYKEPDLDGLSLVRSGSTNKLSTNPDGSSRSLRRLSYFLKPERRGNVSIGPLTVYFRNEQNRLDSLRTQPVSAYVGEAVARGPEGFMPGSMIVWFIVGAFGLTFVYFVLRYLQRRGQNDETKEPLTLEQKYSELLHETVHIGTMKSGEAITQMVKLLNSYIAEKFSIPGVLDEAIVQDRLQAMGVAATLRQRVAEMYAKAEKARFANEAIAQTELHLYYDTVEQVLNPQPMPSQHE